MPKPLLTFQQFNDPGLAETVAAQLKAQGIDYVVEKEGPVFDATFANNDFEPSIHLKIAAADFPRAHAALEGYYQSQLQAMDADYYLFSFTNAELLEIIRHPDEWGHLDYALAKKLLADRGHAVTPAAAEQFREQRITELARPEKTHPDQIIFGYVLAVIAGLFGIFLGYAFARLKKTLPNGELVYVYPPAERRHGRRIMIISTISIIFWVWRFLSLGDAPWARLY